jgi:hypothetical protein
MPDSQGGRKKQAIHRPRQSCSHRIGSPAVGLGARQSAYSRQPRTGRWLPALQTSTDEAVQMMIVPYLAASTSLTRESATPESTKRVTKGNQGQVGEEGGKPTPAEDG